MTGVQTCALPICYGTKSISDYICLFTNMLLLYFMVSTLEGSLDEGNFLFNISWSMIFVNLIVHWLIKRFRYSNLDADDHKIINRTVILLTVQFAFAFTAAFLPPRIAVWVSLAGLAIGGAVWYLGRFYRLKPARFSHITERCALLIIVTFGETIVAISTYMSAKFDIIISILIFALVVGLFLIYIYEHDNMLDHHANTDGMGYMIINAWIVFVVSNITIALEFMPDDSIAFLPKSIYITAGLVLYLLTSFMLSRFNKPQFRHSVKYPAGRLVVCALIIIVGLVSKFDPLITLVADVVIIYGALLQEFILFRSRTQLISMVKEQGITREMIEEAGYDLETDAGRKAFLAAANDAILEVAKEKRRQHKEERRSHTED